jgi:dTDP-4-dehydrorhamnose reductase
MTPFDFSRVLTTGGGGMIGSYVDFGLRPDHNALDVLDAGAVMRYVREHRPSAIIHLVGATDTQKCESDPLYAYELNVRGTYNIACAAKSVDAVMVYVSTSRVFKGDKTTPYAEEDVPEPETQYGRTKHIGELITKAIVPNHIIARTAWVFGGGPERDNKFYGSVIRKLMESKEEVAALLDVAGSPTYAKDFIEEVRRLLEKGEYGTFHIANRGVASRFDIAHMIAEYLGSDPSVRAVDRSHFATGAMLPTNESISSTQCALRPWKDALIEYLSKEWQVSSGNLAKDDRR